MAHEKNTIRQKIRRFILQEKIPFPAWLYYWLLGLLSKCKNCYDGVLFPQYVGSIELKDKSEWPDNYDDVGKGCGVYYCHRKGCEYSKEKQHKKLYKVYNNGP